MKINSDYILVIFLVISIIAIISFYPSDEEIPVGLPNHYLDLVDEVNNSNTLILIYSDEIDLNNDVPFTNLSQLNESYSNESIRFVYLIIDMDKYKNNYEDTSIINDIYENSCVYIVIANYNSSNSFGLVSFLDNDQLDSDLIFTQNDELCDTTYSTNIYSSDFPELKFLNYAIIDNINRDRTSYDDTK